MLTLRMPTALDPIADGTGREITQEEARAMQGELKWLALFAEIRSKDDSKTFARVNRGALRTIAERARGALP